MARLDIATEDEKQGIITPETKIPKLRKPVGSGFVINMSFLMVAIFVTIGVLIFILNRAQITRLRAYENAISSADEKLDSLSSIDKQATEVYNQINNLKTLWSQKNAWSSLMDELASTTTNKIKLDSVTYKEAGSIELTGKTNSLTSIAKFLASFENNKNFGSPLLTSINYEADVLTFGIEVSFSSTLLGTSNPPKQE